MAEKTKEELQYEQDFLEFESISNTLVKVNPYSSRSVMDKVRVLKMLDSPFTNVQGLQNTSQYLYYADGRYKRIIDLMSTMVCLDGYLIPYNVKKDVELANGKVLMKTYINNAKWLEKFDYKVEFSKILKNLFMYGEYYGYYLEGDNNATFLTLPKDFCRVGGYSDEVGIVEFNFNYFNSKAEEKLLAFPKEFTTIYKNLKKYPSNWVALSEEASAFTLFPDEIKGVPYFTGMFSSLYELLEYKDLSKEKAEMENYAMLHLKAPWKKDPKSHKDVLVPLPQLKAFHKNAANNTPTSVGVVTDFLDMELFKFADNSPESQYLANAKDNIYDDAGVSNLLFNNNINTSTGLEYSTVADMAVIQGMLRKFEQWLKREMKKIVNADYNYRFLFLDNTYFDRADKMELYRKAAEYGGSAFMFLASTGLSPMGAIRMTQMENAIGLKAMMTPLQSANTTSGDESVTDTDTTITDTDDETTVIEQSRPNVVRMKYQEEGETDD